MNDQTTETPRHVHGGYEYPLDCPVCALEVVRRERDEARARLGVGGVAHDADTCCCADCCVLREVRKERDEARAKAIQFDLDRAGIEQRAAEAAELVDLRAEVRRLREALPRAWNLGFVKGRDYESLDAHAAMLRVEEFRPESDPKLAALAGEEKP